MCFFPRFLYSIYRRQGIVSSFRKLIIANVRRLNFTRRDRQRATSLLKNANNTVEKPFHLLSLMFIYLFIHPRYNCSRYRQKLTLPSLLCLNQIFLHFSNLFASLVFFFFHSEEKHGISHRSISNSPFVYLRRGLLFIYSSISANRR